MALPASRPDSGGMSVTAISSRRPALALVDPVGPTAPKPPRSVERSTRVVVADGQALVRAGLRSLLDAELDIVVLGEAADAAETRDLIATAQPAVVLLDTALPGLDGAAGAARLIGDPQLDGVRFVLMLS